MLVHDAPRWPGAAPPPDKSVPDMGGISTIIHDGSGISGTPRGPMTRPPDSAAGAKPWSRMDGGPATSGKKPPAAPKERP